MKPQRPTVKPAFRRRTMSIPQPVPCTTCFAVCRLVDGVWVCPKHGPRTKP